MTKKYVNYESACRWIDRILADEDKIQDVEKVVLLSVKSMLNRLSEEVDICNHGKWELNDPKDDIVYCNQCMMPSDVPTNYCHSCGARMDLM